MIAGWVLAGLVGCGDTASAVRTANDAAVDAAPIDAGNGVDVASTSDDVPGRTTDGVYLCCAPGEGTACCAGRPQGTCFRYGGVLDMCVPEGGDLDAHDICETCCPGLVRIDATGPTPTDACGLVRPPGAFYCTHCGDGACGQHENHCNCPADCAG